MPRIAAELEGVVQELPVFEGPNDGSNPVVFNLLGIKVVVMPSAAARGRISTPTLQKSLTLEHLTLEDPLPGRSEKGFIGCTAIVVGNYDTDSKTLEVAYPPTGAGNVPTGAPFEHHPSLEIGPPETVLLGTSTNPLGESLAVNGVTVQILKPSDDPRGRLIPDEPTNEFGLAVDPARIPQFTPVSVDGYLNSDGGPSRFLGFAVVVDSNDPNTLANRVDPQIGITRAQGRDRDAQYDLDVRGGLFNPDRTGAAPPGVEIKRLLPKAPSVPDAPEQLEGARPTVGFARVVAAGNGFFRWRFDERLTSTREYPAAPSRIQALYRNPPGSPPPVFDADDVDVRENPDVPAE